MSALEKRTSLNQAVTKAHLPAETAYKSVGSFASTQILLWEIKIKQHINKPGIFHSRKQMSFTKQLILWQLDLKSGSSMGKNNFIIWKLNKWIFFFCFTQLLQLLLYYTRVVSLYSIHLISVNAEVFKATVKDTLTLTTQLPHTETRDKATWSTEILDSSWAQSTEARSKPSTKTYTAPVQEKHGFSRDVQHHPSLLSIRAF